MSNSGQIRDLNAASDAHQESAILVVTDDEELRALIGDRLSEQGYRVDAEASGPAMLDRLKSQGHDIVLLDLESPGVGGAEALRQVREKWADLDIIMVVGTASIDLIVDLMKAGAAELVSKPVNLEHLCLLVEKTLYRRRLEQRAIERDHFAHLTRMDGLTGVYNHRFLQQMLDAELPRASRYRHPLCLLMIDVDDFKHYNDMNGHPAGDKMLRELADMLRAQTRAADFVARYGGEEFAIVLTETNKVGGTVFAERLVEAIAERRFEREESQPSGQITVSVGLACYPDDAGNKAILIERADSALYQAKANGKNRVSVFTGPDGNDGTPGLPETVKSAS